MLKNDTLSFDLMSNSLGPVEIVFPEHGDIDNTDIGTGSILKTFNVKYYPDADFIGQDKAILKYYGNPGTNWLNWSTKKVEIEFEVLNSIVETKNDYLFLSPNSAGEMLNVLVNDSTSGDTLFVSSIFNQSNCEAWLIGNQIFVHPNDGFEGMASFNYLAKDDFGSTAVGNVIINVSDNFSIPDSLDLLVTETNSVPILFSNSGFVAINGGPSLGQIDYTNDPELIYKPFVDSVGLDQFEMSDGIDTVTVNIGVLETDISSNLLVDDAVYTVPETEVHFNVTDNDYDKTSFYITNYSSPSHGTLTHSGNGQCVYTPEEGFVGFDEFTYTRQLNFNYYQTAKVNILVSDFKPDNNLAYQINVPTGKSFVLNYMPPIDSFNFELNSGPENGTVDIYPGLSNVNVNCEEISGRNLIVYTPNSNYIGTDRFEVRYCNAKGNCRVVKIDLNVVEPEEDTTCQCLNYTCVWEGDSNGDGIVNMKDILPITDNAGIEGTERDESSAIWYGLGAQDWVLDSTSAGNKLKYYDCNGDGFISDEDKNSIVTNYNKVHNLYFSGKLTPNKYPVFLTTDQDTVHAGEVLYLNIVVGDQNYPAKDISGLSYTIQLDPSFIDSSSLHHNFISDSWLTYASTTMNIWEQPFAGQVEAAIGRVGGNGITGVGMVSTCDFIIEDDFDGIKKDYNNLSVEPISIKINNISIYGSNGEITGAPDQELIVYLVTNFSKKESENSQISIYPIPSR
ncbi:MAG: Ig-like domain-containing protein [Saprospiraceae bacterium]